MTTTSTDSRKTALFARTTTAALVASALMLDAKAAKLTSEERLTRSWIFTEIEARMGGVQDDAAFDALLDTFLTYTECLLVTFPALVA